MVKVTRGLATKIKTAETTIYSELMRISQGGSKVFLIEGHGRYPLWSSNNSGSPKAYVARRAPQKVPSGKAIIYMAEPGKCMLISIGRQVTNRYFHTQAGIVDYLTGVAERAGVHHADVSRKTFLPGDEFYDSTAILSPEDARRSFGYIWKLPLKHERTVKNSPSKKNRSPSLDEVLNFRKNLAINKRHENWISDIVRAGPDGVYIVFTCLDMAPLPTEYNFPNIAPNFYTQATKTPEKKHIKRGIKIRTAIAKTFKTMLFKRPAFKKPMAKKVTVQYRGQNNRGADWTKLRHTPFPANASTHYFNIENRLLEKNKRTLKVQKKNPGKVKVADVLRMIQNNVNININSIPGLPASTATRRKLEATRRGLSLLRNNPSSFFSRTPSRVLKWKVKAVPSLAAQTIHSAITNNPKVANFFKGTPPTPRTSPS